MKLQWILERKINMSLLFYKCKLEVDIFNGKISQESSLPTNLEIKFL